MALVIIPIALFFAMIFVAWIAVQYGHGWIALTLAIVSIMFTMYLSLSAGQSNDANGWAGLISVGFSIFGLVPTLAGLAIGAIAGEVQLVKEKKCKSSVISDDSEGFN